MTRVAWTARLRPDRIDAYVEAHANVWPDVLAAITAAGIRDYSIWLFEDRVFAQYECDDPAETIRLEDAAEATGRWRALMREYFVPELATEGVTWLPEIFRVD
jgi:L-rhamnose mutarotase